MKKSVNDNENGFLKPTISMNNGIDRKYTNSRSVERIADRLVEKFGNAAYRQFYCKVAWRLSEGRIWDNAEQAMKGNSPSKLFTYLCKRDGV